MSSQVENPARDDKYSESEGQLLLKNRSFAPVKYQRFILKFTSRSFKGALVHYGRAPCPAFLCMTRLYP